MYQKLRDGLINETIKNEHEKIDLAEKVVEAEQNWELVFEAMEIELDEEDKAELEF